MKNPARVAELLTALKEECEYRFEFAAVALLESHCLTLPRVKVLDDSHQEFLGKIYDKQPSGHYRKGKALHRVVWEFFFGEIPVGCEIHHRDENPANNQIENLQCLTRSAHRKLHNPKGEQIPKPLKTFVCEWCGKSYSAQDTGNNRFCSDKCRYKSEYHTQPQAEKICPVCGKKFMTRAVNGAQTCSRACARLIRKEPRLITLSCKFCGKEFQAARKNTLFCSAACRDKAGQTRHRVKKICPVCGKEFSTYEYNPSTCCSQECANTLRGIGSAAEHTCPICGKKFFPPRGWRYGTFCSPTCRNKHRDSSLSKSICPICGKKFTPSKRTRNVTCSRSCAAKLTWQKRRT